MRKVPIKIKIKWLIRNIKDGEEIHLCDILPVVLGSLFLLVCILCICLIVNYEHNAPTEGVVVEKNYKPAYIHTVYRNETNSKRETITIPMTEYEPERYYITIKGINKKGKEQEYKFQVSPSEYEKIEIGDFYIRRKE